ncbi:MAG: hypothetical protein QXD43_00745 [Candidatus Aenigmatarchaeota archaeon]
MKFNPVMIPKIETYEDASEFTYKTKKEFERVSEKRRIALSLQSGGVDSTTCGIIAYEALGPKLFRGIHFEHGGMRKGECKEVLWNLNSECKLPVTYKDFSEIFMKNVINAGKDSEEKRRAVSETYFNVALNLAKENEADILIHGTIKPDWLETERKIKRQHNVIPDYWKNLFEDEGIIIAEPLYHLYKPDVRNLLRYYRVPSSITERKPFLGPGLYCRAVGQVSEEKMEILREADSILMPSLENYAKRFTEKSNKDFQCLCAIMDNKTNVIDIDTKWFNTPEGLITEDKVTGMKENKRTYTNMLLIDSPHEISYLSKTSEKFVNENLDKGIGRVAVQIEKFHSDGEYNLILRSIITDKFTKAQVMPIEKSVLQSMSKNLEEVLIKPYFWKIAGVYYDVTPKPPATIEFE